MQRTLIALITLSLIALFPAPTGTATSEATVTVIIEAPESLVWDYESFTWEDTITVTEGASALDLLATITDDRDSSYDVTWADLDGDGTVDDAFVDEINGVRGDFTLILVGTFWALYQNDVSTSTGAAKTIVQDGDTLRFSFEGFPASA